MTEWFREHLFMTFAVIYVCIVFVYVKVFRLRKLPILKELIIYLLIGAGSLILFLFQVDLRLPIVPCLLAAVALMLIVRIRTFFLERPRRRKDGWQ